MVNHWHHNIMGVCDLPGVLMDMYNSNCNGNFFFFFLGGGGGGGGGGEASPPQ